MTVGFSKKEMFRWEVKNKWALTLWGGKDIPGKKHVPKLWSRKRPFRKWKESRWARGPEPEATLGETAAQSPRSPAWRARRPRLCDRHWGSLSDLTADSPPVLLHFQAACGMADCSLTGLPSTHAPGPSPATQPTLSKSPLLAPPPAGEKGSHSWRGLQPGLNLLTTHTRADLDFASQESKPYHIYFFILRTFSCNNLAERISVVEKKKGSNMLSMLESSAASLKRLTLISVVYSSHVIGLLNTQFYYLNSGKNTT